MKEIDPRLGWPRVHAECDYKKPLRLRTWSKFTCSWPKKKSKALTSPSASASSTARRRGSGPRRDDHRLRRASRQRTMAAVAIPKEIADRLEVAPPERLE